MLKNEKIISQDIKNAMEEFKKMEACQRIAEPEKTLGITTIPAHIAKFLNLRNKDVLISRKTLKHIIERRGIKANEFINSIPDVLNSPTKIADNSKKTPDSYLFAKMNGKAKGVVLEVKKTPEGNQVISAFPIDKKTYKKMVDISGRAEFPPSELPLRKNSQQILSDVRKSTTLNIPKNSNIVNRENIKTMEITEIQITPIKPKDGLIAFASFVLDNSLYLGFIGVHTRIDGSGYRLTYPTKKIGDNSVNIYHPINKEASQAIEQAVFKKLKELFNN